MNKEKNKKKENNKIYIKELRPDMTQCRIIVIDKKEKAK